MLTQLSSESTNFKFALAKYATSRRISCFGSADKAISYIDKEYQHKGSGRNRLKLALSKMVLKQFEKRPGDRKTDTAKVRFTFSIFTSWSKLCDHQIQISIFSDFHDNDNHDNRDNNDNNNNNNNNEYLNRMTHECIQHCYQRGPVKETIVKIR